MKTSLKEKIKKSWNWLWNSDSLLSYVVFLAIIFVIIKFIFLPGLGLIFGTQLPLAIVESSSMEHYSLQYNNNDNNYVLCDKTFNEQKFFSKEEYWNACGNWYEQNTNITKSKFENFKLSNGFRKGDLMIIFGKSADKLKVGDVIIFNANRNYPIIHRLISLDPIQTKGDHNSGQLNEEKNIQQSQIIGVAVAKIPKVGWVKLFVFEHKILSLIILIIIIIIYMLWPKKKDNF